MESIEPLFEIYKSAVAHKDLDLFVSIFDEKIVVFDMWQQWSFEGLPAWREMAKSWFSSLGENRDIVTFDNIQIQSAGEMSWASAIARFTALSKDGEELRYLENRVTWVAQKKDLLWKIIHQHTSAPIDFQTMKVILNR